jgi:hypothetical protein
LEAIVRYAVFVIILVLWTESAAIGSSSASVSEISVGQVTAVRKAVSKFARVALQHRSTVAPHLKSLITEAALKSSLPPEFLIRLIRQESAFNPHALSPKGAQGVAQFMPATAAERGLKNPFDPQESLFKAAELLKDLRDRFGNWGLACAAYNAGPERIRQWLVGSSALPAETRHYVLVITGREPEEWAPMNRRPFLRVNRTTVSRRPVPRTQREAELSLLNQIRNQGSLAGTMATANKNGLCSGCIDKTEGSPFMP